MGNWPLRRILFWVAVIAIAGWVVKNPTRAGNTVSNAINTVIGWGNSFIIAIITVVTNLTG